MLAFKVSTDYSEILMTHGGNNILTWMRRIKSWDARIKLAANMLRQGIHAIKVLHNLGYAHGDLKPENICARRTKNGKFKFSIIDFGICQKLPDINVVQKKNDWFRGNYMFCSDMQLEGYRPNQYCDLLAFVCVAFYIVNEEVPCTKYAVEQMKKIPKVDLFATNEFT